MNKEIEYPYVVCPFNSNFVLYKRDGYIELCNRNIMNSEGYPELVGWISRGDPGLLNNATNLGWKLCEEYRCQGLMTQLLNLFIAENEPDLDGFAAKILKANLPSIKLALRCGFKIYHEDNDCVYVQKI